MFSMILVNFDADSNHYFVLCLCTQTDKQNLHTPYDSKNQHLWFLCACAHAKWRWRTALIQSPCKYWHFEWMNSTMHLPTRLAARLRNPGLFNKLMSATEAAALIPLGGNVGMSGFTGAGHPKAVPPALAARLTALHAAGQRDARINVWTGASTAPELDGVLAKALGMGMRLPYQSDPTCRQRINAGQMHTPICTCHRWLQRLALGCSAPWIWR